MKKVVSKTILIILLFLPVIAVAHLLVFPQETKCILIDFADFKKQENVYYRNHASATSIKKILQVKSIAEKKVFSFWQDDTKLNYKLIYCDDSVDFEKYGRVGSPAVTNIKLGAYVVIPKDMDDENILAHEISHTVLYRNLGWYTLHFKVPTWFDEGLAMQVDNRDMYSIRNLPKNMISQAKLAAVMRMNTGEKFHNGSLQTVISNYIISKFVVNEWLKKHSLKVFIKTLNNGKSFSEAYAK